MNDGKAYGFFDCKSSKEAIETELPTIRNLVQAPPSLELLLTEDFERISGDNALLSIAHEAKQFGMKYVLEATFPHATNKETADELATILNQVYQSPLYQGDEQFRGEVVYLEDNGVYVFRD